MTTRTREQYLENARFFEASQVVKEPERATERAKEGKAGFRCGIATEVRIGLLDLQLFLTSFLPPYGTVFRHSKDLSPQEKAYREMDLLVF